MTAQEMYSRTLELINKEHTGTIYPEEFEIFINIAQESFLKNRYSQVGETEKRIDDLRNVKVIATGIAPTATNTFTLPSNYLFMLAAATILGRNLIIGDCIMIRLTIRLL